MAGHRRLLPRDAEGRLHPTSAADRPARIRGKFLERYADAGTLPAQIAASKDYLLAAAVPAARHDEEHVRQVLSDVDSALRRAADSLVDMAARRRAS